MVVEQSPILDEVSGVVLLDRSTLGFDPRGTNADLLIHASVDASTWKLEVLGPLGTFATYVDEYGNAASTKATNTYVRVREGCWEQLKVTFATPGNGKVAVLARLSGV